MKRILFVDDDMAVLRGLERSVRSYRRQWECTFIGNPAEALDLIGTGWPDAVVTDMRMPCIDGVEVLAKARACRPDSGRFILSGEVGHRALLPMLAVAHQCIGKPCKTEILVELLTTTVGCQGSNTTRNVVDKIYGLPGLPVMPLLHQELCEALQLDAREREAKVYRLLTRCPAMAAKILQAAAWVRFGSRQGNAELAEAIRLLGFETISAVIHSDACRPMSEAEIDVTKKRIWRECAAATGLAQAIATIEQCTPSVAEQAMLVTVLSGVGPILFNAAGPEEYELIWAEALACDKVVSDLESESFGVSSGEAAAQMLHLWGLHGPTVELVAAIDDPRKQTSDTLGASSIAHISKALIRAQAGIAVRPDSLEHVVRLGLVDRLPTWERLAEVQLRTEPG